MKSVYSIIVSMLIAFSSFAAQPRVAVLVEPHLFNFAGQLALSPQKISPMLKGFGIDSVDITADQMNDAAYFNTDNFSVIVLAYGNAFPLVGYENLKKFHSMGGCMVVNGIPFSHPAQREDDRWNDLGHINYLMHDEKGIGAGGFADPDPGINEQRVAAGNILGLPADVLPRTDEWQQFLDTASFPAADEVIAIVETKTNTKGWTPATALIKHKCPQFDGAMTLWLGQTAKQLQRVDYYCLKQILVRGIAYMLHEKSGITDVQYKSVVEAVSALEKPQPLPSNITAVFPERPWGDTFLPKSNTPAEHLYVVDMDKLNADEKIAVITLQGLTSRKTPCIWLNYKRDNSQFWLDWHKEKGYIKSYEVVDDWASLFVKFADSFQGAVVADENMYRGSLIAVNVASCEDLIIASEALAKKLGLPVKVDLRGRFDTYSAAMKWVWDTYKDKLNHHFCDSVHPSWLFMGAFSYDIQWRSPVLWVSATNDGNLSGADPLEEMGVIAGILSAMPAGTAFLGFPYCGEGVGLGEVGGTSFFGGYGKSLVCTDNLSNLPVTSGVRVEKFTQPTPINTPKLDKDKIYVALVFSDGDNENIWRSYFKKMFDEPDYGKFPVSFGMGPAIWDLQPAVAQWYYEHAAPSTEFISDVSGIGYMRPENYGSNYANRQQVIENFVDWTGKYLKKMDMRTMRTVSGSNESIYPYIKGLPFMHSLFADMGRYSGYQGYENLTYSVDGMPVFRCHNTWDNGAEGVLDEIRKQVGDVRPAFVNSLAHCWTMDSIKSAKENFFDKMGDDIILVTPSQLADLYRQAQKEGLTDPDYQEKRTGKEVKRNKYISMLN